MSFLCLNEGTYLIRRPGSDEPSVQLPAVRLLVGGLLSPREGIVSSVLASGTWHKKDVSEALRSWLNAFINARISLRAEVSPSLC